MTKQEIRNLIAAGRLEQAIEALLQATANDPHLHDQVTIISGNFNRLKSLSGTNQTSFKDTSQKTAEITSGLLSIVNQLTDDLPVIKPEAAAAPQTGTNPGRPNWLWALGAIGIVVAGLVVWQLLGTPPEDKAKDLPGTVVEKDTVTSEPPKPQPQPVVVKEPVSIDFYGVWKNTNANANTMKTLTISKDDHNQVWVEVVSVSAKLGKMKAQIRDQDHLVLAPFKYFNYATYRDANIYLEENGTLKMTLTPFSMIRTTGRFLLQTIFRSNPQNK